MRVAFFGDIHGNLAALDAVLTDMEQAKPDQVVCLGDLAFKGPQGQECVDRVAALGVPTIMGNTDRYLLADPPELIQMLQEGGSAAEAAQRSRALLEWNRQRLDARARDFLSRGLKDVRIDTGAGMLLAVHGSPNSDEEGLLPDAPEADLAAILQGAPERFVVFGHVHLAFVRPTSGKTLIGAGSVGRPYDGDPRAAWTLVEAEGGVTCVTLRRVPYDVETTVAVARAAGLPGLEAYVRGIREGVKS